MSEIKSLNGYALVDEEARKTDPTLAVEGMAADAKAVGDALANTLKINDNEHNDTETWSSQKIVDSTFPILNYHIGDEIVAEGVSGEDLSVVSYIDYTPEGVDSVKVWHSANGNYLPKIKPATQTSNGVTAVMDEQGVLTFNGTPTNNTSISFVQIGKLENVFEITPLLYIHANNSFSNNSVTINHHATTVSHTGSQYLTTTTPMYPANRQYVFSDLDVGYLVDAIGVYMGAGVSADGGTVSYMLSRSQTAVPWVEPSGQYYKYEFGQTVHGGYFEWSTGRLVVTHDSNGELEEKQYIQLSPSPILSLGSENHLFGSAGNVQTGGAINPRTAIESLLNRTTALEKIIGGDADYMPSYWAEYLDGKLPEIREKIIEGGNTTEAFSYFTDIHIGTGTQECASTKSRFIIDWLRENTTIRKSIFGGDIVNTVNGQTREQAISWLWRFHDYYIASRNVLPVIGNHEISTQFNTSGDTITHDEAYSIVFKHVEEVANTNGHFYYYFDNASQKVRYIVLDTMSNSFSEDSEQVQWYIDALETMELGWTAVLFSHSTGGGVETQIAGNYNSRSSGSHSGITWDFSNADGVIACMICGHLHKDMDSIIDGLLVIHVTTDAGADASNASNDNEAGGNRHASDVSEQAVELFFVNTEARTIETIRLGYGVNRSWTY